MELRKVLERLSGKEQDARGHREARADARSIDDTTAASGPPAPLGHREGKPEAQPPHGGADVNPAGRVPPPAADLFAEAFETPGRAPDSSSQEGWQRKPAAQLQGSQLEPLPDSQPTPVSPPGRVVPGRAVDSSQATQYNAVAVLPSSIQGVLVVVGGAGLGAAHSIGDGESRIGRNPDLEIILESPRVSRHHASIIHEAGHYWVEPANETNKSFIDSGNTGEQEVTGAAELSDGDLLRVADTSLRFRTIKGL